jgi:WD40 repeat protein
MRPLFSLLLLTAFLLPSCAQSPPEPLPTPSPPATATIPPLDRPLIAYQAGSAQNKTLLLADPAAGTYSEFSFPAEARFATPFLAGLSPDARYFVYFEGGWLETPFDVEHLRAGTPDLVLHILDLRSGEVIFSAPLLSPSFPQDLAQVAETIKDEWGFTNFNATFEEVIAATQEMMLDRIRNVAWSPDGSLLAFASQNPGPTSDLYFFSLESGSAQQVATDPGHVLRATWAPDSSALVLVTSLYDRQAREDTTYLLSREGLLRSSFTSQLWFFNHWHDSTYAFLYGGTDAGDFFGLKTASAADGMITMLWEGTYADIAFSPDLSTFLIGSSMPTAPIPPHPGLFLGRLDDDSLLTLSEIRGWGVAYWGSERFAFAASSIDEGTVGVTLDGECVTIDEGYWKLAASPGSSYLAGYHQYHPSYAPGVVPGLRVFDGSGLLLASEDVDVTCVGWDAASTALAYQVESRLYLWDAAAGASRLVSDQLNEEACAFQWVRDNQGTENSLISHTTSDLKGFSSAEAVGGWGAQKKAGNLLKHSLTIS